MSENGSRISDALISYGFDIAHFFDVASIRGIVPTPLVGRSRTGLLIGNTRALWSTFSLHLTRTQGNHDAPLDHYTEDSINASLSEFGPSAVKFAHHLDPQPLPIQRICAATGFAAMSPMGMNVHVSYGPWFALRAVAFFDFTIVPSQEFKETPCDHCKRPCEPLFQQALHDKGDGSPRRFLSARKACPVGREHEYSEDQLAHHYDRNPLLKQS